MSSKQYWVTSVPLSQKAANSQVSTMKPTPCKGGIVKVPAEADMRKSRRTGVHTNSRLLMSEFASVVQSEGVMGSVAGEQLWKKPNRSYETAR